jgi:hypothetical protein
VRRLEDEDNVVGVGGSVLVWSASSVSVLW